MDRSSRQKIDKETAALNSTLDHMDLIDNFRALHPKAAEYTYFSSAHVTFSRIDHILGHKTSLYKFKKIEIISSIFSDNNAMKLEISHKTNRKICNDIEANILLNNEWVNNKIKEQIKIYFETNENEDTTIQNLWDWENNPKREIHTITSLSLKKKKAQINNRTSHLKEVEKEQQTKPKVKRGNGIIKIRIEINKIES